MCVATVHGPDNSQHIADWYTPSHIIHGFLFYLLGWLVLRRNPPGDRLIAAVSIEAAWEMLENSPIIIDRYREATIALGYTGDSVINSVADVCWMMLGFGIARRLPVWATVALALGFELLTLIVIRDNLFLNVLMLVCADRRDPRLAGSHLMRRLPSLLPAGPRRARPGLELFAGLLAHDVDTAAQQRRVRGRRRPRARLARRADRRRSHFLGAPSPYVFGSVATGGETHYGRGGAELADRRGPAVRPARHRPRRPHRLEPRRTMNGRGPISARASCSSPSSPSATSSASRVALEASWVHVSHAQLFSPRIRAWTGSASG